MKLTSRFMQRALRLDPPLTRDVVAERDLRVPMPDGVVLLLAGPVRRSGAGEATALPLALMRCPYGRRA